MEYYRFSNIVKDAAGKRNIFISKKAKAKANSIQIINNGVSLCQIIELLIISY